MRRSTKKIVSSDGEVEVLLYRSPKDGVWVVEVDTSIEAEEDEDGPVMRVTLNEETLHGKYPFPGREKKSRSPR